MESLRMVPQDEVLKVITKWDHLAPAEKNEASIHQLITSEGLNPVQVVAWMAAALYAYNANIARMLNALNQPEVMKASVESAKILGKPGFNDREMQLKISGVLQETKSPLVNINVGAGGIESQEEFLKDVTDV